MCINKIMKIIMVLGYAIAFLVVFLAAPCPSNELVVVKLQDIQLLRFQAAHAQNGYAIILYDGIFSNQKLMNN